MLNVQFVQHKQHIIGMNLHVMWVLVTHLAASCMYKEIYTGSGNHGNKDVID